MSETKDYSLLRPFDEEAAKRGEAICWHTGEEVEFVAADMNDDDVCVRFEDGGIDLRDRKYLRMAPLCWVEGRPVYRGDVLWWKPENRKVVAAKHNDDGRTDLPILGEDGCVYSDTNLTWTPPKVKREVKLLAFIDEQGFLRHVREELFCNRGVRVPHLDYLIPVEEPAEVAK